MFQEIIKLNILNLILRTNIDLDLTILVHYTSAGQGHNPGRKKKTTHFSIVNSIVNSLLEASFDGIVIL